MAHHVLDPEPRSVVDVYTRSAPALRIESGDRLTVRTLDAGGYLEPWRTYEQEPRRMFDAARGHCLAGPIVVAGAAPGQFLAVELASLRPATTGYTVAGGRDNWLNQRLDVVASQPGFLAWDLDAATMTATNQHGFDVTLAPFLGVIGTVPDEPGEHSTIPPRPRSGGNIDCRELVAGSTLFLPVEVPGAYLFLGDGHAAQGDGEVGGTAIECGMTTEFTVTVVDDVALDAVHAVTPGGQVTFGFDSDLNEATAAALGQMVTWLQRLLALDRPTALVLASVVVDLRITQIANGTWGVHAVLGLETARSTPGSDLRAGTRR
jgi:acetamidase/formamidase